MSKHCNGSQRCGAVVRPMLSCQLPILQPLVKAWASHFLGGHLKSVKISALMHMLINVAISQNMCISKHSM